MQRQKITWSLIAAIVVPALAYAADPLPYTVKIAPTGDSALDAAISGSAQLVALRTRAPAGPFAIVTRARQDVPRLKTITIAGHGLDDPDLPALLTAAPAKALAAIAVQIDKGPLFHLRHAALTGAVPAAGSRAFTLQPGEPAIAGNVLGAASILLG
jgi:translocation and assembly module TamA